MYLVKTEKRTQILCILYKNNTRRSVQQFTVSKTDTISLFDFQPTTKTANLDPLVQHRSHLATASERQLTTAQAANTFLPDLNPQNPFHPDPGAKSHPGPEPGPRSRRRRLTRSGPARCWAVHSARGCCAPADRTGSQTWCGRAG